jgi:hypothetical protein
MSGSIEELIKIENEAIESIPTLTEYELFLFNKFLIKLLESTNREMRYRLYEKEKTMKDTLNERISKVGVKGK